MMKRKIFVVFLITVSALIALTSCAGIGDGALADSLDGKNGDAFIISADKLPTINDYTAFTCFISSYDEQGNQNARMELANGGTWMMYEYFTEAEYQRSAAENRSVDYKDCVTFSFREELPLEGDFEGESIYGLSCDVRVYFDDYVVYTYYNEGESIEVKGFLDGAYSESSKAYSDAVGYFENKAGYAFDSLIIQAKAGKTYTASDFPEIDCTSVNRMMTGEDGTVWWVVNIDSTTEEELLDAFAKLESREDVVFVQHNYIYSLS